LKNLLIRFFLFLFRSRKRNGNTKRILVVSTTALGDTLWATPSLSSLKKHFDFVAVLTSPLGAKIFQNNPNIDKQFVLTEPVLFSFFSLFRALRKERFDTILIFHSSQRLTLPLCSLLGASKIVGTTSINKGLDSLLTDPVPKRSCHEIERRFEVLQKIGLTPEQTDLQIFLTEGEKRDAHTFLKKKKWTDKPLVVIHPGAKDGYKCWPKKHFIQLGNTINNAFDCHLLISSTPDEKQRAEEISSQIPNSHLLMLPLRMFASVLAQSDLLISNDTGPMHLACSVQCPTVAIFSPTDPKLCGPLNVEKAHVLSKKRSCNPCIRRKCKVPFCLLQISPDEVFQKCQTFLAAKT